MFKSTLIDFNDISLNCRFPSSPSVINGQAMIDMKNCALSDLSAKELDPVRHLQVDRSADIYERNPTAGRNCREGSSSGSSPTTHGSNLQKPVPARKLLTIESNGTCCNVANFVECFERVKTGIRLERKAVRYTLSVNSPLECEQECINTQFFTCRAFSYR